MSRSRMMELESLINSGLRVFDATIVFQQILAVARNDEEFDFAVDYLFKHI
jgi:hypothetical protein